MCVCVSITLNYLEFLTCGSAEWCIHSLLQYRWSTVTFTQFKLLWHSNSSKTPEPPFTMWQASIISHYESGLAQSANRERYRERGASVNQTISWHELKVSRKSSCNQQSHQASPVRSAMLLLSIHTYTLPAGTCRASWWMCAPPRPHRLVTRHDGHEEHVLSPWRPAIRASFGDAADEVSTECKREDWGKHFSVFFPGSKWVSANKSDVLKVLA